MEWITELMYNFCMAGALVYDTCTGKLAIGNTCLHFSMQLGLVIFKENSIGFQNAVPLPVKVNVKQILSPNLNIAEDKEAVEGMNLFLKELATLESRRRIERLNISIGLVSVHPLPMHVAPFYGNI